MPNTLVHFGIQGVASQALFRNADAKWIFLSCVIPDVPWILLRITSRFAPGLDPYDLHLYAIVQSSLAACILLSAGIALLAKKPWLVFGLAGFNSLAHLLVDALQTKWANGVHLFAPFTWELTSFGLFWPESPLSYALTVLGLIYFISKWRGSVRRPSNLSLRPRPRLFLALAIFTAYLLGPVAFLDGPEAEDIHYVKTLRNRESRPGKSVVFDRQPYFAVDGREFLRTWAGEELRVTGEKLDHSGRISARATFKDEGTIIVHELHEHSKWWRNGASIAGLLLLATMWAASLARSSSAGLGAPFDTTRPKGASRQVPPKAEPFGGG